MAMQFNKPRFDWETKDRLSKLEQFKQECSVFFQGPLSEMKDAQKAGLVVNWIGRQCVMTLHSIGIELDSPKTVFESLCNWLKIINFWTIYIPQYFAVYFNIFQYLSVFAVFAIFAVSVNI